MRCAVTVVERDRDDVVVLRGIRLAAGRAPVGVDELPLGLDIEDLAPVFVRLPLPLAFERDRASDLPVGLHVGAKLVLLDPLRVGEGPPDLGALGIDVDGCLGCDLIHGDLQSWLLEALPYSRTA